MGKVSQKSRASKVTGLAVLALVWPACLLAGTAPAGGSTPLNGKGTFSRTWKLQELLPPPGITTSKPESAADWSARQGNKIMTRVTKAQSGPNVALRAFHDRQGLVSEKDQNLRLAALKDIKQPEFQEKRELSRYLLNQLGKAIGAHAQESSEFLRKLGQGLSFDLGGSAASAQKTSNANNSLRYGLVLREVRPTGNGVHVATMTMDDSYLDRALASKKKAQVDWTIGPLSETSNTNLFPDLDNDAVAIAPVRAQGIFNMRPDFKLTGKVLPNFTPDTGGTPGVRLRLEQPQGLYRMETPAGASGSMTNMVHEFRLPVYGKLVLTRQMDSRMEATKSSVLNVFGFSEILGQQPLNLYYTHADSSLKAETGFALRKGRVGVEANIANTRGNHPASTGAYTVNYGRNF